MSDHIITGIDVGTYQVKVAIARLPKKHAQGQKPEIIGTGLAESRGLKNGYIIDLPDVVRSIKSAVALAEKTAGVVVKRAHVSVGSIGLEETYSHGEIIPTRADSEVTDSDLEKVMQDSEERITDHLPNRRILHSIPLRYSIDGTVVLGRPQGLKGTKLELNSLFITTYEQHVSDLIRAIEQVGIYVEDVIASPLAASFVLLSNAQKRAGCVLINIGAETTSMAVFEDMTPISLKIFPVGSNDITNDIALELRIPPEDAEKVKRGAMTSVTFNKKRLEQIVHDRLQKIYELVQSQLMKIERDGLLPAGAVLTGGGSATSHAADIAKDTLKLPARIATLEIGKTMKVRDSSWAVAYGLCMWGASGSEESTTMGIVKQSKRSLFSWLNQFLP